MATRSPVKKYTPRGRGRPTKDDAIVQSISIKMPASLVTKTKADAADQGMPHSAYLRHLIERETDLSELALMRERSETTMIATQMLTMMELVTSGVDLNEIPVDQLNEHGSVARTYASIIDQITNGQLQTAASRISSQVAEQQTQIGDLAGNVGDLADNVSDLAERLGRIEALLSRVIGS